MSGLEVSTDEAWLETFGVVPATEAYSGDDFVREVKVPIDNATELDVTWNVTDGSVRLRLRDADRVVIDTFRESARRLLATEAKGERSVIVEYGTRDARGRIEVRASPDFAWTDNLLRG